MAISAEDKKDIDQLRGIKANHLADIAETMVQRRGQNEALDSAGRKFTILAAVPDRTAINPVTSPLEYTKALNTQLEMREKLQEIDAQLVNPATKTAVINLLERNPAGFEKVLPQIFANPGNTATLIQQQLAAAPAQAAKAPQAVPVAPPATGAAAAPAARTASSAPAKPAAAVSPLDTAVASPAAAQKNHVAPGAAAVTPTPKTATTDPQEEFLDFLKTQKEKNPNIVSDFAGFKTRIDAGTIPEVTRAYQALTEKGGDPAQSKAAMVELKKTIETQPQFFANINKTMDKNPGALTGIANDAMAFGGGPAAVLKGVAGYSQFAQSNFAQDGFGKMILQFLDGFFGKGGLAGMINGLLGKVGIDFKLGTDGKDLQVQSNNNGAMTRDALKQQGSNPASVAVQDASASKQTKTGAEFTSDAPSTPGRSPQEQRALQEALGVRPGA